MNLSSASLSILPTPLKPKDISEISPKALEEYKNIDIFIVERQNKALQLLNKINNKIQLKNFEILEYNQKLTKRQRKEVKEEIKNLILAGKKLAVISEAGLPNLADPGKDIIAIAHMLDIKVKPIGGTSSICLAIAGSGLNGNSFSFHGYLPINKSELNNKIKQLQQYAKKNKQIQVFIETPHRNRKLFETLLSKLSDNIILSLAFKLNYPDGFVKSKFIPEWKNYDTSFLDEKAPAVFLIGAYQYHFSSM